MRHFNRILGLCLPLCLVACGSGGDTDSLPGATYIGTEKFGADERRAAQTLSVGAVSSLTNNDDPYREALLCSISLETVADRLAQADILDDRGMTELRRALSLFDERAGRLGSEAGKDGAQINQDKEAEKAAIDIGARAQIGIGCLRKLAAAA